MAKLTNITQITDPEPEQRWLIRPLDIKDVSRHIENLNVPPKFWEGFSWTFLGGGFSFLVSIISYHLFTQSPEKNILIVGYTISILLLFFAIILISKNNSEIPSFEFHKKEALEKITRIEIENRGNRLPESSQYPEPSDKIPSIHDDLITDLKKNKSKLFEE
ncbi:MAG: hypothetical protein ACQETL_19880 [Bacteroidota bacterium]